MLVLIGRFLFQYQRRNLRETKLSTYKLNKYINDKTETNYKKNRKICSQIKNLSFIPFLNCFQGSKMTVTLRISLDCHLIRWKYPNYTKTILNNSRTSTIQNQSKDDMTTDHLKKGSICSLISTFLRRCLPMLLAFLQRTNINKIFSYVQQGLICKEYNFVKLKTFRLEWVEMG